MHARQATAPATETQLQWDGAPSEVQNFGPAFHARTYLIGRAFRRLRPASMLDIGCGRGHVTAIAARHARTVYAVDRAAAAVEETRERLSWHADAHVAVADPIAGDWGTAPRPIRGFDAVMLSEVLEHLQDDLGMMAGARELLTPGGRLIATVPGNPALWTAWDDMAGHLRRYTRNELHGKLEQAGFIVERITNWGFPLTGYLAIRGSKMRGTRVKDQQAEVPSLLARVMPYATPVFAAASRVEPLFSRLDRGAGYVAIARRRG
jgi:SAM-dependent methyltransferase